MDVSDLFQDAHTFMDDLNKIHENDPGTNVKRLDIVNCLAIFIRAFETYSERLAVPSLRRRPVLEDKNARILADCLWIIADLQDRFERSKDKAKDANKSSRFARSHRAGHVLRILFDGDAHRSCMRLRQCQIKYATATADLLASVALHATQSGYRHASPRSRNDVQAEQCQVYQRWWTARNDLEVEGRESDDDIGQARHWMNDFHRGQAGTLPFQAVAQIWFDISTTPQNVVPKTQSPYPATTNFTPLPSGQSGVSGTVSATRLSMLDLANKVNELSQWKMTATQRLDQLQQSQRQAEQFTQNAIAEATRDLQNRLAENANTIEDLHNQVDELNTEFQGQKTIVDRLNNQITQMKAENARLLEENETLQRRINSTQNQPHDPANYGSLIRSLQATNRELTDKVEKLESNNKELAAQLQHRSSAVRTQRHIQRTSAARAPAPPCSYPTTTNKTRSRGQSPAASYRSSGSSQMSSQGQSSRSLSDTYVNEDSDYNSSVYDQQSRDSKRRSASQSSRVSFSNHSTTSVDTYQYAQREAWPTQTRRQKSSQTSSRSGSTNTVNDYQFVEGYLPPQERGHRKASEVPFQSEGVPYDNRDLSQRKHFPDDERRHRSSSTHRKRTPSKSGKLLRFLGFV